MLNTKSRFPNLAKPLGTKQSQFPNVRVLLNIFCSKREKHQNIPGWEHRIGYYDSTARLEDVDTSDWSSTMLSQLAYSSRQPGTVCKPAKAMTLFALICRIQLYSVIYITVHNRFERTLGIRRLTTMATILLWNTVLYWEVFVTHRGRVSAIPKLCPHQTSYSLIKSNASRNQYCLIMVSKPCHLNNHSKQRYFQIYALEYLHSV